MFVYDRFETLRASLGITKAAIAKAINRTATICQDWKAEKSEPNDEQILVVAEMLRTTPEYLRGESDDDGRNVTAEAFRFARTFDQLDGHGQDIVKTILEAEYNRIIAERKKHRVAMDNVIDIEQARPKLRHYLTGAAAGYISPVEGEDYEDIEYPDDAPTGADFCVTISGDSMEPYIKDGSMVYVKRDVPLKPFDVGIFFVDGNMYCKQYCPGVEGILMLLSANPKREDANIIITPSSGQTVACFGKVLLKKRLPQPNYRR